MSSTSTKAIQFAVTPSFNSLVLDDSSPVSDALIEVMRARGQLDHDGSILNTIMQQTRSSTVGDLRRLTDHDWRAIEIPAIARIYLKYVVRQSARSTVGVDIDVGLVKLQDEFNYGRPIMIKDFEPELNVLVSMGFTQFQSLESLCITGNKSVEGALELLFLPNPAEREKKRQEAVFRLGRGVDGGAHEGRVRGRGVDGGAHEGRVRGNTGMYDDGDPPSSDKSNLLKQLVLLKRQCEEERQLRERSDIQWKLKLQQVSRTAYKDYVRSVVAEDRTVGEQLTMYREIYGISAVEHDRALTDVGISAEQFENIRDCKVSRLNECVVCLTHSKEYVLLNCMHVCLCESCVPQFQGRGKNCPICGVTVSKVARVFF